MEGQDILKQKMLAKAARLKPGNRMAAKLIQKCGGKPEASVLPKVEEVEEPKIEEPPVIKKSSKKK